MAKKAKDEAKGEKPEETAEAAPEGEAAASPKKGIVGRILSVPKMLNPLKILKLPLKKKLIVAGALVVVLGAIGGAVMFLGGGAETAETEGAEGERAQAESHLPAPTAAFYDMPDVIVNIQTADGSPAYLKLTVALEVDSEEAKTQIEPVLPRIVDQFQTYLRELRIEDVRGSVGAMRLKEELLRRVNLAAAPIAVRDVLFKELIVQ